ncbi:MAG TPA: hypothetical protein VFC10_06740 [Terriglobia bacterium]|nr:hypothetical protein [Terriglobia bacterium]
MGETPHQLEEEISRARTNLDEDLLALRRRARQDMDRRIHSWLHPFWIAGAALAGALLIGFFLGRAGRS